MAFSIHHNSCFISSVAKTERTWKTFTQTDRRTYVRHDTLHFSDSSFSLFLPLPNLQTREENIPHLSLSLSLSFSPVFFYASLYDGRCGLKLLSRIEGVCVSVCVFPSTIHASLPSYSCADMCSVLSLSLSLSYEAHAENPPFRARALTHIFFTSPGLLLHFPSLLEQQQQQCLIVAVFPSSVVLSLLYVT